jgi:hypothetical protein
MKIAIFIVLGLLVCGAAVYVAPGALGMREDPLASLTEPTFSDRYTSAFWATEHGRNSDLWSRALSLCAEQVKRTTLSPNCTVLGVVAGGGAQERLAREELAERGQVRAWLQNGQSGEVSNGLTGRGARGVPSGFGQPKAAGE